jgi:transcriptional regulator with XRE-family HTH domain
MKKGKYKLKDRLRSAREAAGYSGTQVAKAVGMSQPSYRDLEMGISKGSTKIVEIADFLRVDPTWLQMGKTPEEGSEKTLSSVEMELIDIFRSGSKAEKSDALRRILKRRELQKDQP